MDNDTLLYLLTGATGIISVLGGALYTLLRKEAEQHAEQINQKANSEDLKEVEARWHQELNSVREDSKQMVNKLEARHERDLDQLSNRLTEQMRNMETNILAQIRLLMGVRKE